MVWGLVRSLTGSALCPADRLGLAMKHLAVYSGAKQTLPPATSIYAGSRAGTVALLRNNVDGKYGGNRDMERGL